jgi:hypothetical protein
MTGSSGAIETPIFRPSSEGPSGFTRRPTIETEHVAMCFALQFIERWPSSVLDDLLSHVYAAVELRKELTDHERL